MRSLFVGLAALMLAAVASAQFDGPAPLAWRWVQPTRVAPSGAPLVDGSTIYTAVGGRVFALDLATGNLKWRFPAVDPIEGVFRNAPVLVNGVLVAVGDNKIVFGIDPATGQSKWSLPTETASFGPPVVVAGKYVVIAQSDNKLIAIDPEKGSMFWSAPYNVFDGIQGQLGASGNNILFFNNRGQLWALDVVSQRKAWQQQFSQIPPNASPVVYNETIYINSGPFLIALNASTGTPRWQTATQLQLAFSPAVSAAGVLVTTQDGQAMLYDLASGRPTSGITKPIDLGSLPAVRPVPVGGKFVVPTTNGAINLIDPASGKLIWSYLVRPIGEQYEEAATTGGRNGGAPGAGGAPGRGGGIGGRGGAQATGPQRIYTVQVSGPPVLSGQTLLVPARDGSLLAFDKDLGVDLTAPSVKMVWPNPGDQVSGQPPLQLFFRIEDEAAGINESTLKIEIDGKPYEFKYGRDGVANVQFSAFSKTNKLLTEGRKTITVTVSDWLGNESKTQYSLTIDNTLKPLALPGTETTNPGGFPGGRGGGGAGGGKGGGEAP